MSILIVDDSPEIRLLLTSVLKAAGYTKLTSVGSAREAFEHLGMDDPARVVEVDLILMDILMTEMDGIEACYRIKVTLEKEYLSTIVTVSGSFQQQRATSRPTQRWDRIKVKGREREVERDIFMQILRQTEVNQKTRKLQ